MGADRHDDSQIAELARRIAARRERARTSPRLRPGDDAPLNEAQTEMWLAWRLDPEREGRHVRRFRITGRIDRATLEAALGDLVARHEALRTSYPQVDGRPRQLVHDGHAVPVEWVELEDDPDPEARIAELVAAEEARPVDLTAEVPVRIVVASRSLDDHDLVLSSHHVVLDGWSERILADELGELYRRRRQDPTAAPPEALRPSVADLAWRDDLATASGRAGADRPDPWREALAGASLANPWSGSGTAGAPRLATAEVPAEATRRLEELGRDAGTTLFASLLAAVFVVLADEWRTDRPVVGISIADRLRPGAESTLGRFATIRPFAGDLRARPTVAQLVEATGRSLVSALGSGGVPQHELRRLLADADRDHAQMATAVDVQLRNFPRPGSPVGDPWIAPAAAGADGSKPVDLSFEPAPDGGLTLVAHLVPGAAGPEALERFLARLLAALHLLPDLSSLPVDEAARSIDERPRGAEHDLDAPLPVRAEGTVVDRILEAAASRPDAIAVEDGPHVLKWAELARRSWALAEQLRLEGLQPGQPVVVTGTRSAGYVVAVVGTLLAGGAVVPLGRSLEPADAEARLRAAGAERAVVVGRDHPCWVASLAPVTLDPGSGLVAAEVAPVPDGDAATRPPSAHPGLAGPALWTFPSPGGDEAIAVPVPHGEVLALVDWLGGTTGASPSDRFAAWDARTATDVVLELLLPLGAGATVAVAPVGLSAGGALAWLAERHVTVAAVPPATAWAWLAAAPDRLPASSLRWTILAGGTPTGELADRWRGRLTRPGHLLCLYGPDWPAARHLVPAAPPAGPLPIGWPIPGSQVAVTKETGVVVVRTPFAAMPTGDRGIHRFDGVLLRTAGGTGAEVLQTCGARADGALWCTCCHRTSGAAVGPASEATHETEKESDVVMHSSVSLDSAGETTRRLPATGPQTPYLELYEVDPAMAQSKLAIAYHLDGALDVEAFTRSVASIVDRHAVLRTRFDVAAREQIIEPGGADVLTVVRHHERPDEDTLLTLLEAENGPDFDLEAGPLVRLSLHRFADDDHVLHLMAHHAVLDGMSFRILINELMEHYSASLAGRAPEVPELTADVADLVAHEEQLEADGTIARELQFWRDVLAPEPPVLDLPTDRPRPRMLGNRHDSVELSVRPSLLRRLDAVAAELGVSPFRAFVAVYAAQLARLAGCDDIVVGVPASARDVPGSEHMLGMFVNVFPLRLQVRPEDTVRDLILHASERTRAAGRHRHAPFGAVHATLGLRWDPSRHPVYQVMGNLFDASPGVLGDEHLTWTLISPDVENTRLDLNCRLSRRSEDCGTLALNYNVELFDRSTAGRIAAGVLNALEAALDRLDTRVADLPEVPPAIERAPDLRDVPLHRRVKLVAETDPARPAVVDGDLTIDYGTLDHRIDELAGALVAADVRPGQLVGVHVRRSADLVAATLAVHRVGAGFVPLDPEQPAGRLQMVVEDARPVAVIADRDPVVELGGATVIRADVHHGYSFRSDPWIDPRSEDPAYVLFTSGSTGRPKGVIVPHRALEAFVDAANAGYGVRPGDRVLQMHSIAFDAAVEELFVTLGHGATLVLRPDDLLGGIGRFARFVEAAGITVLDLPTSIWHTIVQELEEADVALPASVRLAIIGGQAANAELVKTWQRRTGGRVRLVNSYGPTEVTVVATIADLTDCQLDPGAPVSIGRPIGETRALVVDEDDRPVAQGEIGELLLGGPQVALGYIGRPELTAERFVELDGDRWYRTGDLVRQREDGELEFRGRADDQVKIRGFRIEPGDVEATILAHPDVREVVVLPQPSAGGDPVLVAHLLGAPGAEVDTAALAAWMRERVPAYLVPARFVVHQDLPRTPGGKPDRRALRDSGGTTQPAAAPEAPDASRPEPAGGERLPVPATQAGLWYQQQLAPSDTNLLVAEVFHIRGPLDVDALAAAVDGVVARHEGLRAVFALDDDGHLFQEITPATGGILELVDLTSAPEHLREGRCAEVVRDLALRPFSLEGPRPVRAALVRVAPDDHRFVLSVHHVVFDAESSAVVYGEIAERYAAAVEGRPAQLAALGRSYTEVVRRRGRRLTAEESEAQHRFWAQELSAPLPLLDVPRVDPAGDPAEMVRFDLGPELLTDLEQRASELRTTPFVVALAAYAAVLGRITGQADVVVGVPMIDRDAEEAGTVGLFVNTLPVRIRLGAAGTFRELVGAVRASVLGGLANSDVPFPEVVQRVQPPRQPGRMPVYQTMFQLLREEQAGVLELPGVEVTEEPLPRQSAQSELAVDLRAGDRRLHGVVVRQPGVLGPDRVTELVEALRSELETCLADPDHELGFSDGTRVATSPEAGADAATGRAPAPATAGAELLDGILAAWREVLDDPDLGPDSDFFASGGHSLVAVRLFSLLERRLGIDLPLTTLFDHPTPRALAAVAAGTAPAPSPEPAREPAAEPLEAGTTAEEPLPQEPLGGERAGESANPVPGEPGPVRLRLTRAPLSFAQERFWLLRQMEQGDSYLVPLARRLLGRLDRGALESAFAAVVARQEILRTRYLTYDDGTPYQVIDPAGEVPIEHRDLRTAPDQQRQLAAFERHLTRPFELGEEWPVRVGLARVDDAEHVLYVVLHHIACDPDATVQLWSDLADAYEATSRGLAPDLPELELQYSDLAVWQRAVASAPGSTVERAVKHFRELLDPLPEPLALPRSGEPVAGAPSGVHRSSTSPELAERLRRRAAELRTTPTGLILTAVGIALARITGQHDMVVGMPVTERHHGTDDGIIGPFVNTLPLRLRVDEQETARAAVERTRAVLVDALAHRDAPFERVVQAVSPVRGPAAPPLLQVAVNVLDRAEDGERSGALRGLRVIPHEWSGEEPAGAKFELTVQAFVGGTIDLVLEHRADLFDPVVVATWSDAFHSVLAGLVEGGDRPVGELPIIPEGQRRWLLEVGTGCRRPYPSEATVDELFEKSVAGHPEAVAVVDGDREVTYAELAETADGIAERLRAAGVGTGDTVGITLGRSCEHVAATIACLRLGAVYVPVEPNQPQARTDMIFQDAAVRAVIGSAAGELTVEPRDARGRKRSADGAHRPESPAYVMFTSGSTGRPKGVVVPHRAIVRLVAGTDYVQLGPDDVVAFASNPAFDAATWEIWGALLNGGRLVVLDRDTVTDPDGLAGAIRRHRISAMFVTTALFNVIARHRPDAFTGMRAVLFGGEACDPRWVREVLVHSRPDNLLNVYGPTESTTYACWFPVEAVPDGARTLPIGRPIANTTCHVLDPQGRLLPTGAVGELHIGGDGLAVGYLGDEELTARRFVPDPLEPGGRLYKTGDLVRRRPDGELEFVGRVDRQVKVRGFRIEPEEVEAAILEHPSVSAVAVLTAKRNGTVDLLGYAEAPAGDLDPASLRTWLRERLPAHMVPASLVVMPALPLNANGKIDRKALPDPEEAPSPAVEATAAGGHGEGDAGTLPPGAARLLPLWTEVLGVATAGPDESFFDLGGHSLLAVQLFARMRKELGVDLPLSTLFERPTLRSLGELVEAAPQGPEPTPAGRAPAGRASRATRTALARVAAHGQDEDLLVPLRSGGSAAPLFCIHPAGGHVFHYERLAAHLPEGRPVIGVCQPGLGGEPWGSSVEEMAERYLAEIRASRPEGPYLLAGYSSGGVVAFEMARRLVESGDARPVLVLLDPPSDWQAPERTAAQGAAMRWRTQGLTGLWAGLDRRVRQACEQAADRTHLALHRRTGRRLPLDVAGRLNQDHMVGLMRRYEARPVDVEGILFRAVDDGQAGPGEDSWRSLVGTLTVVTVPGSHIGEESLMREPRVAEVAAALDRYLSATVGGA